MFDVKHNFDRLIEVLWNEEPDRLPFYEHLVDNEVIEAITGEPVTKLEIYDPGIARLKEEGSKIMRRVRRFAKALIKFYRGMGYDTSRLRLHLGLFELTSVRVRILLNYRGGYERGSTRQKGLSRRGKTSRSIPSPAPRRQLT